MANDLLQIADIAITQAVITLRNNSVLARLVNRDYESEAAQKNKTIDVPVFNNMAVQDVTPGRGNENVPTDVTPVPVKVTLDQWKEVRFQMSDKEMAEIADQSVIPPVMARSIQAIADTVDNYIATGMYRASFLYEPAAAPATEADVVNLRKALNAENVPKSNRRLVVSDDIEAELLIRAVFHQADARGDTAGLVEGSLGRKFGFDIASEGAMPSHTAGTSTGWTVNGVHAAANGTGGVSTVAVNAGMGTWNPGDRINFAGHAQDYVIVRQAAGTITVAPRLRAALANTEAITIIADGSHAIGGLAFHEMAYVFATRPLASQGHPGVIIAQTTDPLSGLSLRLTAEYVNKATEWSLDILYGGIELYPEGIARLAD